jgi:hypothetical protein
LHSKSHLTVFLCAIFPIHTGIAWHTHILAEPKQSEMSFLWKNLGLDVELGGGIEKARPIAAKRQ